MFSGASNKFKRNSFDYNKKKLENPFYSKKKKITDFVGLKTKIIIFAVILIVGAIFWLIYFSNIFTIQNIEINELKKINSDDVKNMVWEQGSEKKISLSPQNNLIFFDKKIFYENFKNNYRFQDIEIKKKWPSSILLNIEEKDIAAAWIENEKYYFLDNEGYVLGEANPLEIDGSKYPLIQNDSDLKIIDQKISQDGNLIIFAQEILKEIQQKSPELSIVNFSLNYEIDSLFVSLLNGPKIIFNTKDSASSQIEKFLIVKEERIKENFTDKAYIDLRFGDKIYYQ